MKILILANNDVGLYKFRKELLEVLNKNHEVHISLPYGQFVDNLIELGCIYHNFEFLRHNTNPIKELQLISYYKKLIKQVSPHLVFTYTIKPNVYGGLACQSLKVPYFTNITGLGTAVLNGGFMGFITLFLYKIGLKKANIVFFQNESNKNFFIQKKIVTDNYILLPGSGVNLQDYTYKDYPENDVIKFLFIGRIMKDKGIEEFLECAKHIKNSYSNTEFSVIGDFDDEKYHTIINEYHEQNIIQYLGVQNDVRPFIQSHHAIILPSYHEGISNVLLESSASGRPVIATDVPGCRETYDDGISGLSCKAKSSQSLISAVEKFINLTYDEKTKMGIAARKKVESQFDRKIVIDLYLSEIRKLSIQQKRGNL